jgi:hypothetical protein
MEPLVILGIGVALAAWAYKAGKRFGSQKGYRVGRFGRFRRRGH